MPSSASTSSKTYKQAATTQPVEPTPTKEAGMGVAENVYEKAKDIWAWGKGVPLVSIGFAITEAFVGKAVNVAGTDFETLRPRYRGPCHQGRHWGDHECCR
jgi:hypothetical protein